MAQQKRLWKIAGTEGSNGINSCPTVMGYGENDVALQGFAADAGLRGRLVIPGGEDIIVMPRELFLRAARKLMEDE